MPCFVFVLFLYYRDRVELLFPTDCVGSVPDFDSHISSTRLSPSQTILNNSIFLSMEVVPTLSLFFSLLWPFQLWPYSLGTESARTIYSLQNRSIALDLFGDIVVCI